MYLPNPPTSTKFDMNTLLIRPNRLNRHIPSLKSGLLKSSLPARETAWDAHKIRLRTGTVDGRHYPVITPSKAFLARTIHHKLCHFLPATILTYSIKVPCIMAASHSALKNAYWPFSFAAPGISRPQKRTKQEKPSNPVLLLPGRLLKWSQSTRIMYPQFRFNTPLDSDTVFRLLYTVDEWRNPAIFRFCQSSYSSMTV